MKPHNNNVIFFCPDDGGIKFYLCRYIRTYDCQFFIKNVLDCVCGIDLTFDLNHYQGESVCLPFSGQTYFLFTKT